jgi:hypothetical protein
MLKWGAALFVAAYCEIRRNARTNLGWENSWNSGVSLRLRELAPEQESSNCLRCEKRQKQDFMRRISSSAYRRQVRKIDSAKKMTIVVTSMRR